MNRMEKKEICLEFDKLITNLAGNRFGADVYEEQIKNKIAVKCENTIIFPIQIEDVASSFIQGMYKKLGEEYGKATATQIMKLYAMNKEADEKIKDCIETYGVWDG